MENRFIRAEEVADELGVSKPYAYKLIRQLNEELKDKGFMGFSAVAIADRVGHESIEITYRYAHLFPSKQTEMADKLDFERMGA